MVFFRSIYLLHTECSSSTKRGLSGPEIKEKKIISGVLKSFWTLIVTYARKFMQILDFYA